MEHFESHQPMVRNVSSCHLPQGFQNVIIKLASTSICIRSGNWFNTVSFPLSKWDNPNWGIANHSESHSSGPSGIRSCSENHVTLTIPVIDLHDSVRASTAVVTVQKMFPSPMSTLHGYGSARRIKSKIFPCSI